MGRNQKMISSLSLQCLVFSLSFIITVSTAQETDSLSGDSSNYASNYNYNYDMASVGINPAAANGRFDIGQEKQIMEPAEHRGIMDDGEGGWGLDLMENDQYQVQDDQIPEGTQMQMQTASSSIVPTVSEHQQGVFSNQGVRYDHDGKNI